MEKLAAIRDNFSRVFEVKIIKLSYILTPFQSAFTCSNLTIEILAKSVKCSKLTIKTPEQRQWRCSGVSNVNFEHILHFVLVFLLLTLNI